MNKENYFIKHLGQTSPFPFLIDIQSAEGIYIIDKKGNVVWKFNSQLNAEGHISKAIEELKELN